MHGTTKRKAPVYSGGSVIGAPFARDLMIVLKAAEALQDTMPRSKMHPSVFYVYLQQYDCPQLRSVCWPRRKAAP